MNGIKKFRVPKEVPSQVHVTPASFAQTVAAAKQTTWMMTWEEMRKHEQPILISVKKVQSEQDRVNLRDAGLTKFSGPRWNQISSRGLDEVAMGH
ncbi:hypothetical protein AAC387_Pa08g2340 [Persea americana]